MTKKKGQKENTNDPEPCGALYVFRLLQNTTRNVSTM
jgi:hypothetical protein